MTKFLSIKYRQLLSIILLSQLLSGCALFQSKQSSTLNQNTSSVEQLTHWQLKGKLIFKSPEEKFSASLNWKQNDEDSDIRLTTFLGISILKLKQDKNGANLEYDGNQYQAKDAKTLLMRHTRLNWPIEQMSDWVKGVSTTPGKQIKYNQNKQISQITLLDYTGAPWQLSYPSYQQVSHNGQSYQLPKQIKIKGHDISITIKVSRWTFE